MIITIIYRHYGVLIFICMYLIVLCTRIQEMWLLFMYTYMSQVCDDTNQASGFAAVGTTAGLGRLMVNYSMVIIIIVILNASL